MNKKTVAAGFATLIMAVPALALAQSASTTVGISADVQTQIQSLLSQIASLQQQLKNLLASSTIPAMHEVESMVASSSVPFMGRESEGHANVPCVAIMRNLTIGSSGEDVKQLQDILADDPEDGFTASSTGFFGPMTARAMMYFQERNGIASSSTGFVGPMTRSFFKEHCGGSDNGVGNHGTDNGYHGGIMIRVVSGTVTGSDHSSVTVQTHDSNTVTVNITASTTIMVTSTSSAPVAGTIANLTTGTSVVVEGRNSSNDSVDATRITVGVGLIPIPPTDDAEEAGTHASSTAGGLMHGLMQFFNPFMPHNDNGGEGN